MVISVARRYGRLLRGGGPPGRFSAMESRFYGSGYLILLLLGRSAGSSGGKPVHLPRATVSGGIKIIICRKHFF